MHHTVLDLGRLWDCFLLRFCVPATFRERFRPQSPFIVVTSRTVSQSARQVKRLLIQIVGWGLELRQKLEGQISSAPAIELLRLHE